MGKRRPRECGWETGWEPHTLRPNASPVFQERSAYSWWDRWGSAGEERSQGEIIRSYFFISLMWNTETSVQFPSYVSLKIRTDLMTGLLICCLCVAPFWQWSAGDGKRRDAAGVRGEADKHHIALWWWSECECRSHTFKKNWCSLFQKNRTTRKHTYIQEQQVWTTSTHMDTYTHCNHLLPKNRIK